MNAPAKLAKIEQLRARDGDRCWLCGGSLDFTAQPNSRKAPTREHLHPTSLGGTDSSENLVLCHPGCNKHLANKPKEEKLRIRAKWQAERERRLRATRQICADMPSEQGDAGTWRKTQPTDALVADQAHQQRLILRRWQIAALGTAGVALLAIGFSLGLIAAN